MAEKKDKKPKISWNSPLKVRLKILDRLIEQNEKDIASA